MIPGAINNHNKETISEQKKQLDEQCAYRKLRINDTSFVHKLQHKIIFFKNRETTCIIIHIITNRLIKSKLIQDIRILLLANIQSNYHLVLSKIILTRPQSNNKNSTLTTKFNIESIKTKKNIEPIYRMRLTQKIENALIFQQNTADGS